MINTILSDNELSEYISDTLTHEHIHKVLDELFNKVVCKLFDGIEHHFRNHVLHEKQLRNHNLCNEHIKHRETYQSYIKRKGFNAFLNYYNITPRDMFYANQICSNQSMKQIDLNQSKNISWKKLKE